MRALDVPIGQLADMHETRILQADIDESAEIDHVQDRPLELHSGAQVLDLQDPLLENRLGKIVSRVALGALERFDDVAKRELAGFQLSCQLAKIRFG